MLCSDDLKREEMPIIYRLATKTGTLTGYSSLSKQQGVGGSDLACLNTVFEAVT